MCLPGVWGCEPIHERTDQPDQTMVGTWFRVEASAAMDREAVEGLNALGYVGGTDRAPASEGVTHYAKGHAWDGLNLLLSGHAPEVALLDMEGRVLHRWRADFQSLWPHVPVDPKHGLRVADAFLSMPGFDPALIEKLPKGLADKPMRGHGFLRRAFLYPNGDLLTFFTNFGMVKLDRDSKVLWTNRMMAHHDLHVAGDGTIYVLDKEIREAPELRKKGLITDEYIVVLGPDGSPRKRVSITRCFLNSPYAPLLLNRRPHYDIVHTNTLEVLDGRLADRIPAFKKGNVLISCLSLDSVVVIDLHAEQVVWAASGLWSKQHQPTILENGNMLVFDNKGHDGFSRIIEFDPLTREVVWTYAPVPPERFTSTQLGSVQRLPNGNTLITESTRGRAFEVTTAGEIVWEFVNPHRAGKNNELIAAIFEVVRIPLDGARAWLDRDAAAN